MGTPLPVDLRSLLLESNGIADQYGLGLVWPVERIVADNAGFRSNVDFRELYMPFDPLLFFADAGNGDQFGFTVLASEARRDDVFVWSHEDDSRTWAAPTLARYLQWWLSGQLKVQLQDAEPGAAPDPAAGPLRRARGAGVRVVGVAGRSGELCRSAPERASLVPPTNPEYHRDTGLPGAGRAEVDPRKLAEYCLSPTHPVGKHKAVVFRAALGITAADVEQLREWLLQAAVSGEANSGRADGFGERFVVDFAAATAVGSATVRSAWIIRTGEDFPRLTTCYVLTT